MDDIDPVHQRATGEGLDITHRPTEESRGGRGMHFGTPDGTSSASARTSDRSRPAVRRSNNPQPQAEPAQTGQPHTPGPTAS